MRPRTSGPGRARPTRRCSTRASTPSPGRSRRNSSRAGTSCSPSTRRGPASRWSERARSSWPGREEQRAALPGIAERARAVGYGAIRELPVEELYRREPHLGHGATGALEVPDEGLVCPFTTPLAFATEAVLAGCELRLNARVTQVERLQGGGFRLEAGGRSVTTRFLVNAAGLHADELHRLLGYDGLTITPRRGELIVFDKLARPLVEHIILAVPTGATKGVLVAPTVFGNVLLGPTAEDIADKDDTSSTARGLAYLQSRGAPDPARAGRARGLGRLRRAAGRLGPAGLPDLGPAGGLRLRGRDPLHGPDRVDGDRGARARRARGRRAGARPAPRRAGVPHAEHRREPVSAVRRGRAHRRGPRVRPDRRASASG